VRRACEPLRSPPGKRGAHLLALVQLLYSVDNAVHHVVKAIGQARAVALCGGRATRQARVNQASSTDLVQGAMVSSSTWS
jgi:hypothetical protein